MEREFTVKISGECLEILSKPPKVVMNVCKYFHDLQKTIILNDGLPMIFVNGKNNSILLKSQFLMYKLLYDPIDE